MSAEQAVPLIASITVALTGIGVLAKKSLRGARRFLELADVILGTGDVPSLGDRLGALERGQARTSASVEAIEHELRPNSGLSHRDALDRTEAIATETHLALMQIRDEVRRNAAAARARRSEDRRALRELRQTVADLRGEPQ